jgi:hypothetical protein
MTDILKIKKDVKIELELKEIKLNNIKCQVDKGYLVVSGDKMYECSVYKEIDGRLNFFVGMNNFIEFDNVTSVYDVIIKEK